MKLLVSAFSCCPGLGSEPGVGWHTVEELAREHEVWVLVNRSGDARARRALQEAAPEHMHVHFVGTPLLSWLVEGPLSSGPGWLLYYYLWQMAAGLVALRLHARIGFEACQHVTFVKYNTPSFLHLLGIPFIWGPVGGAERAPMDFYAEFGWKTRLAEAARVWLQRLALADPLLRWCHRRCWLGLAVTEQTAGEMRRLGARRVEVMPAVALSNDELAMIAGASLEGEATSLTLLYVGRLIPWKGVHLGLRALARADRPALRLRLIGEGVLRARLEAEAQRLGLANRVEFVGGLSRDDVLRAYSQAEGFLYPSLHDSGGNAVIEAMAAGLPVICLRYGGPDLLVPDDCGWKVAAGNAEEAVAGLAKALQVFAADGDERRRRGAAARLHATARHGWNVRGEELRAIYKALPAMCETSSGKNAAKSDRSAS